MTSKDSLKLESGFEIQIRAIQIVETYKEEFLLGEPDTFDNIRVINRVKCPDEWGIAACVVNQKDFSIQHPKLAPYTAAIWMRSNESVNDQNGEFDFSEVVMIFTIESILDFNVQKQLQLKLRNFDWKNHAVNGNI